MKITYLISIIICVVSLSQSQSIRVDLDKLTTLDELPRHLEVFRPSPLFSVKLPLIDTTGAKFIKIFSFWKKNKSNYLVVMILPKPKGEELYIDLNYNNDLTDDGSPHLFLSTENEYQFDLINTEDNSQKTRLVYIRVPNTKNFNKRIDYVDSIGNLSSRVTDNVRLREGYKNFYGKSGTFYWDDRVLLRRGEININNAKYNIGVFDYSYNGLFNDSDDVILVENKQNGLLNMNDPSKYFNIYDAISIGLNKYKLTEIDKYGKWVILEPVQVSKGSFYLDNYDSTQSDNVVKIKIDTSWKQIIAKTLNGRELNFKGYNNIYLLLNFWGEWCKPCISEIPELIKAFHNIPKSKIQFVSFINSYDLTKAKKIIKDSNITWSNILLTKELEKKFKITKYPTNIVILPNGKEALLLGNVNENILKQNIK